MLASDEPAAVAAVNHIQGPGGDYHQYRTTHPAKLSPADQHESFVVLLKLPWCITWSDSHGAIRGLLGGLKVHLGDVQGTKP
eukprot:1156919-Pelagomonas_calceolata.AAC.3